MFKTEEIENWNSNFPDGQIHENDLKHPTELFVVRTLVAFLRKFGFKLDPPFPLTVESENSREKRLFLINLTKIIDRILKCTDKSYACFYLDITSPVRKRTVLMLEVLLNHYYYYGMFAEEVFKIAQESFQKRGDFIRNIEKIRRDNKERKDLDLGMKDEIEKLSNVLPTTTKENGTYHSKIEQRQKDLIEEETKFIQLQRKLKNLQDRKQFLESQTVNDEEVSTLKIELKELRNSIDELVTQDRTVQVDLKHCMGQLTKIKSLLKCVDEVKHLMPAEQLDEYEDIMKKLKENETTHTTLKHEVETLKNTINKLSMDLATVNEQFKSKKTNFEESSRDMLNVISENENRFTKEKALLNSLKSEVEDIESLILKQKEIFDYMVKSIESLMVDYKGVEKYA